MRCFNIAMLLATFLAGGLAAQDVEKKGSFGVVIAENFVKFNYVITYLGDSVQPDQIAFRISFDDTKGYNLTAEISEPETALKNIKNQSLPGKVQRESSNSALILFPKQDGIDMKGRVKFYAEIKGYKLKKDFEI